MMRQNSKVIAIALFLAVLILPLAGMASDLTERDIVPAAFREERIPVSSGAESVKTDQDLKKAAMRPDEIVSTSSAYLLPDEYQDTKRWKREELPTPKSASIPGDSDGIVVYDSATKKVTQISAQDLPGAVSGQEYTVPEFKGLGANGPEQATIFGNDDRQLVNSFSSTGNYPWRTVVDVYIDWPNGQSGGCSGAIIDPHHVLTAGHCVYNLARGGWASTTVIPGHNDTYAPYWLANDVTTTVPTAWYTSSDWCYDVAVIALDRSVGTYTGWMGRAFPADSSYASWAWYTDGVNTAGYPGDIAGGVAQVYSYDMGNAVSDTNHWFWNDVNNGQSGSPTWHLDDSDNRYIMSVIAYHEFLDSGNSGNIGTRVSPWVETNLIQYKFSADPEPTDYADLVDDGDLWNYPNKTTVLWDEPFQINCDVRNRGTANSGGFWVDYWLSTDSTITTGDYLLGWVWVDDISPFSYADVNLVVPSCPQSIPSGTYYIGYQLDRDGLVNEFDETDNIVVDGTRLTISARSIDVTSPNGDQTWMPGSTHPITWTQNGLSGTNVRLLLMKGYGFHIAATIADPVPSTQGLFTWTVPTTLAGGNDYWVKIQSLTYSEVQGDMWSGWITIPSLQAGNIGIFRDGFWILDKNGNFVWDGAPDDIVAGFGRQRDIPVIADWNDDNQDNIGLFRDGFWILDFNGNFQWNDVGPGNDLVAGFGAAGDIPVAKDWNNDGSPEIAVFRATSGEWIIDHNGNFQWDGTGTGQDIVAILGQAGDTPVAGDWNAMGSDKIGIFRDGFWILDRNGNFRWDGPPDDLVAGFGMAGDIPVIADWNDDTKDNIGVFRAGFWILDYNGNFQWNDVGTGNDLVAGFGAPGDVPVAKDWNGDGSPEIAVFRASEGKWIVDYNGNFQWDGTAPGEDVIAILGQSNDNAVAGVW